MGSTWPELDDLIRELGDIRALPDADGEPLLSDATLAVTKATAALTRAAGARGRSAALNLSKARESVEEARVLLQRARRLISASAARRRSSSRSGAEAPLEAAADGQAEAACVSCGNAFVVRYRAAATRAAVAFPVACPDARCEGVTAVEYPADAVDVVVEPLSGD
jgi:hypothetical protein